ncbi:MAG: hypothetical protein ACJ74U_08295 [Jatrophihabitantaceae bacterium]
MLLYGSWARCEGHDSSDLDLIVVSSKRPYRREPQISVPVYSPEQLRSASRTLFGAHAAQDVIVHGPYGMLAEKLPGCGAAMGTPSRRYSVMMRARAAS